MERPHNLEKYQPYVALNSRILRCDGKKNVVKRLLGSNDSFATYMFEFEESDYPLIAHLSYSDFYMTDMDSGQVFSPTYFSDVNEFLAPHKSDIQSACSCEGKLMSDDQVVAYIRSFESYSKFTQEAKSHIEMRDPRFLVAALEFRISQLTRSDEVASVRDVMCRFVI